MYLLIGWQKCDLRRPQFDSWVGKIPWRREQLPTPVFWPREFHELYSPWDHKESKTIEQVSLKVDTKVNQKGMKVRANVSGRGPNHGVFSYQQEFA